MCLIQSARLHLKPCQNSDLDRLYSLWINPQIRQFLFDDRVLSLDEARSFVEDSSANFEQHGYGLWLVYEHENLIGFAGLLGGEIPGLIYGIHPDYANQGYATEAAAGVLTYAFDRIKITKIQADVDEPNTASVRVLQKPGMRQFDRAIVAGKPLLYFEIPWKGL